MSSQLITVNGIVLKETKTKESDKIITVLSKELGIISIYAKSAMRLKSKFHSATGVFTYSEFTLFQGKDSKMYQLNEANIKNIFYKLSEDIEYLSLALYMAELAMEVSVPDEMSEEILRMFLNILHMLCSSKWSMALCKSAFEMRLMCDIGFRPNLIGCRTCNEYEKELFFFDVENGQIVCTDCKKTYDVGYIVCEAPVLMALRYLAYADLKQMFTFNISGYSLICLGKISERYVLYHTKSNYKSLDFLKQLTELSNTTGENK